MQCLWNLPLTWNSWAIHSLHNVFTLLIKCFVILIISFFASNKVDYERPLLYSKFPCKLQILILRSIKQMFLFAPTDPKCFEQCLNHLMCSLALRNLEVTLIQNQYCSLTSSTYYGHQWFTWFANANKIVKLGWWWKFLQLTCK